MHFRCFGEGRGAYPRELSNRPLCDGRHIGPRRLCVASPTTRSRWSGKPCPSRCHVGRGRQEQEKKHVGNSQIIENQSGSPGVGRGPSRARRLRRRRGATVGRKDHQGAEAHRPHAPELSAAPAETALSAEDARFIDSLRKRTSRSLTTTEREQIVSVAQKKPSIDLEINFDYNSATIGAKALPQVTALGQALSSGDLKGRTFVVAGHTDAKGGDSYNQALSEQRADAVKRFLSKKYAIDAGNLVTVGHGKAQLKNPADPFSGDNRRVQIINMSDK